MTAAVNDTSRHALAADIEKWLEARGRAYDSGWRPQLHEWEMILAALRANRASSTATRDAILACLHVAESEDEASTPPTPEQVAIMETAGVVEITRASIRATKKNIAAGILKVLQEHGSCSPDCDAVEAERDRCLSIVSMRANIWRQAVAAGTHEDCALSLWEECEDIAAAITNGLNPSKSSG